MRLHSLVSYFRDTSKNQGLVWTLSTGFYHLLYYLYYKKLRTKKSFQFHGNEYDYFYAFYLATYSNERAIEIPITMGFVHKFRGSRILEVGNVLSHYFSFNHDIVDKYEKGQGVINQDIVEFESKEKYDLIVSISTLEHVGWDETPKDDKKILLAIENLKRLLKMGGTIIITLPFGHNPHVDDLLRDQKLPFTEQYYMKRISKANEWKQVSKEHAIDAKRDLIRTGTGVTALTIGIINN